MMSVSHRPRLGHYLSVLVATVIAMMVISSPVRVSLSQDREADVNRPAEGSSADTAPSKEKDDPLSTRQDALAIQYDRFEKTLQELSDYMKSTDPARADLLIRAFGQSKKDQVALQMHELVRLLNDEQLGDALERQTQLVEQLHGLLGLLQSEDRLSEIEEEKKRLQDLLKDVNKIISQEKGVRSRTERGEEMKGLSDKQRKVAENAKELSDKISEQDAEKNRRASNGQKSSEESEDPSESRDAESEDGESKDANGEKSDGEKSDDKEGDGDKKDDGDKDKKDDGSEEGESESKDGKGKPSDKNGEPKEGQSSEGEPSDSEPSEGEPSESQPSQGQPSKGKPGQSQPSPSQDQQQQQTPGREEIEQARQEMEKAIEELEKQARDKASGHQDEALRKLAEAKARLEEILRQLREEERELALRDLEARFQRMLALQTAVYTGTVALHKNVSEEQSARHHTRSIKLARDEDAIILEAEKALTLLRDEGTSVAFPEAVEQIRDDMSLVSRRLGRAQTDDQTIGYEEDIIAALKEMIEALQNEIEKAKEQKQQQQQNQQSQPQDNSLVEKIAEMKMLRSLQLRINRRTKDLGKLSQEEQASDPDIIDQLRQLSRRQARLQQATHDIVTGKNK
ncbi:MAG: hypothetical protein O3A29_04550 [Planctomycetota bacterium]|nr:hypothetical protein [Planctomycetota bacterium]